LFLLETKPEASRIRCFGLVGFGKRGNVMDPWRRKQQAGEYEVYGKNGKGPTGV
jgi:hypothetical protein